MIMRLATQRFQERRLLPAMGRRPRLGSFVLRLPAGCRLLRSGGSLCVVPDMGVIQVHLGVSIPSEPRIPPRSRPF